MGMFYGHNQNPIVAGRAINGYLYNAYAAENIILPNGWQVPYDFIFDDLIANVVDGGDLKETGLTFWNTPNTGADNSSGFSAYGSGYRTTAFSGIKNEFVMWGSDRFYVNLFYNSITIQNSDNFGYTGGYSLRAVRPSSSGVVTEFTDYDGNVYDVVLIGDYYWTVQNLKTAKLSSGVDLTKITNQTTWNNATESDYYYCAYNNDENNV